MKASEVIYSNLSTLFENKVYPLVRPESEKGLPYLVYTVLNTNATNVIMGYTGREMAYLQLDVYHSNYDGCEDITNEMIEILKNNVQPFHYDSADICMRTTPSYSEKVSSAISGKPIKQT